MSKLQGILFDIDDTLFSTTAFAETARRRSLAAMIQMGLRVDQETLYRDLLEVISEFSSNYGEHYDKLLSRQSPDAVAGLNTSLVVAAAVAAYHDTKFRELSVYEDVLQALRHLSQQPLVLGVITSGLRIKQAEKLVRLRVATFFDPRAIFITDEVGIGKPNPKLYLRACERLGLEPSRTMYVGDHPENDVHASNQAGMISVWNRREGRHNDAPFRSPPRHVIHNFLDLLDILQREYDFDFGLSF